MLLSSRVALVTLFAAVGIYADVTSVELSAATDPVALSGGLFRVAFSVTVTPGDTTNLTRAYLYPYVDVGNGRGWEQYGAETVVLRALSATRAAGNATLLLPWSEKSAATVVLAVHAPFAGPSMGNPPPANAVLSNALQVTVTPRTPTRPTRSGNSSITVYLETWFTPLNFYWSGGSGLAEAIPAIGRYTSVSIDSIRAQAASFIQAGVDTVVVDWTNNVWNRPTWGDRYPNIMELVNATNLHLGVYASLRRVEQWQTPNFVLLLGLNNGPTTPLPALRGELDYIVTAYLANATLGPSMFAQLDGLPLVLIFDGSGANHSDYTHPNFTIRWMSSQNEQSGNAQRGYWSWMDRLYPPVTMRAGQPEAATVAPAFFAGGGWTAATSAMGRSGGLTFFQTFAAILEQTLGHRMRAPNFVNVCQYNEYAGQANGNPGGEYVDSYSADLSNDIEPTALFACGYRRPGSACGGWGWRPMNELAAMQALLYDIAALDDSGALFIIAPAVGEPANYTTPGGTEISVEFIAVSFSSTALLDGRPFMTNVSGIPVVVSIDSVVVATITTTGGGAVTRCSINTATAGLDGGALDSRYPHMLTLTAAPASGFTTRYPLALDWLDADDGAPLQTPVVASTSTVLWLPESVPPTHITDSSGRTR